MNGDDLLVLARHAAESAGEFLSVRPAELTVDMKSGPTDVVTQMDRAAEDLLRDILLGARPGDGLLGEEGGERPGTTGVRWIVDPLDGTVNYLYGLGGWAVAVAAEVAGVVEAAAVAIPSRGETFTAVRGAGAACNGVPIHVSDAAELSTALVATGFAYDAERRGAQGTAVAALLPRVRDIRRHGAAAADLCALAAGRVDAYYERGLHAWDYSAAGLIAAEAGAVVDIRPPESPDQVNLVVAAGPALMPALSALLADCGA